MDKLTDIISKALKEIQVEENIKLSARTFIADCLAPKLLAKCQKVDPDVREKIEEILQQTELTIYWEMPRTWEEATGKMGSADSEHLADQILQLLNKEGE